MNQVSAKYKDCATCMYWMGAREIVHNSVRCETNGVCTEPRSPKYGKKTPFNYKCSFWSKWVYIKS